MQSRWSDPGTSDGLDARVHTSKLLGAEEDLVLHGGGNTSVKTKEVDHTGRELQVLRIKNSGTDLATISRKGFTGLRLDDLLAASSLTMLEDEQMMDYFRKSRLDPEEPSPSVEAFLHAFLPYKYVDHTHADSIVAITNTDLSDSEISDALGNVVIIPYHKPGFKLAKALLERLDDIKRAEAVVLRKHGLITFSNDPKTSYLKHLEVVTRAEKFIEKRIKGPIFTHAFDKRQDDMVTILPKLRGLLSGKKKKILHFDNSRVALEIACSKEAEELCTYGPSTSDMLIRTKHDFLYIADASKMEESINSYVKKYLEEQAKYASNYPAHDPYPSIIVMRGIGIVTQSISKSEARTIMDFAIHSFTVNANSRKLGKHEFLSLQDSYGMEYWPLQEAKLLKFTPKKLQGTISVVTGAANGIGLEAFRTLAKNGSNVIALDVDSAITKAGEDIMNSFHEENLALQADLTDERQIEDSIRKAVLEFGGIDVVFNNAGILKTAPLDEVSASDLDLVYRVNSRGTFLITREAFRIMKEQGLGGNFVFNITKNLTHPGAEMTMYGSTKAFAAHISHYVAKEGGKYRIRSNIINPDKVFKGSRIWEGGVLESRAKAKGQTVEEYKTQNLLGVEVLPEHVVGVLMALLDESAFGATTDAMIPIDGGIK